MGPFTDTDNIEINEIDVTEESEQQYDDLESFKRKEESASGVRTKTRRRRDEKEPKTKKNKYGWAFFLASMFSGIGLTATFEAPIFMMLGLGFGFLFFVDPIYEKVMEKIENL